MCVQIDAGIDASLQRGAAPLQQFAMMVAVVDAALLNEPHEEK